MQYNTKSLEDSGYCEQALLMEAVFAELRTKINELKMDGHLELGETAIIPCILNLLGEAIRNYYADSRGAEKEKKMKAMAQAIGLSLSDLFEWDVFDQYSTQKAREVRKEDVL